MKGQFLRNKNKIALLNLNDKVECYRQDFYSGNAKLKRKKRVKAINTNKPFNLDAKKMQARLEIAEKSITARESNDLITKFDKVNNYIYCCKTGAVIGQLTTQAITMVNQLIMPFDIPTPQHNSYGLSVWQDRHAVHPAWFNTSPPVLAQLQRIMPHEYCVYVYTYLLERNVSDLQKTVRQTADVMNNDETYSYKETKTMVIEQIPAPFKNKMLQKLYTTPLIIIVEIAELLRIFAALMGKSKAIVSALPNLMLLDKEKYRTDLLNFIQTALCKEQKTHHSNDINREQVITLADLHQITDSHGMRLFNEAKISLDDNNPILADVAELFDKAGLTSTIIAKDYSQIKHIFANNKTVKPNYETKIIKATINNNHDTPLAPIRL